MVAPQNCGPELNFGLFRTGWIWAALEYSCQMKLFRKHKHFSKSVFIFFSFSFLWSMGGGKALGLFSEFNCDNFAWSCIMIFFFLLNVQCWHRAPWESALKLALFYSPSGLQRVHSGFVSVTWFCSPSVLLYQKWHPCS